MTTAAPASAGGHSAVVGWLFVAGAIVIGIEALKHLTGPKAAASGGGSAGSDPVPSGAAAPRVLPQDFNSVANRVISSRPTLVQSQPSDGGASEFGSGLLPTSWYRAIQLNESTLPWPSPGDPQPAFGIIPGADSGFACGVGVFRTGGTNDTGAGPGYTRQALFCSTQDAFSAFDALLRKFANATAFGAISSGDFSGFLHAIAPWYAGGSETTGWPPQVLSHCAQLGGC